VLLALEKGFVRFFYREQLDCQDETIARGSSDWEEVGGRAGDLTVRNFEGCLIASKLVTRLRSRALSAGGPAD